MVGAILRSSGGPNVNNHHRRNIAAIGSAPSATAAPRETWPRIFRKESNHMRQTLRKASGPVNSPRREGIKTKILKLGFSSNFKISDRGLPSPTSNSFRLLPDDPIVN